MTDQTTTDQSRKDGWARRILRGTTRIAATGGVIALSAAAIQFGSVLLSERADAAPAPKAAPLLPVTVAAVDLAQGYDVNRSLVGQIEPRRTVTLSFELAGRLDSILVDEGDRVVKGQVIATLDTQLLDAERDRLLASQQALAAQARFAQQVLDRQSSLRDSGFASTAALDEAIARVDELGGRLAEIEAALSSNTIQSEKSVLTAPFDGTIATRAVDGDESLGAGQQIVSLVDAKAPQLRIGVPLDIAPEDLADVEVEVGLQTYAATLTALRPDVDPVTRTRTAVFSVQTDNALAYGQTARVLITQTVAAEGLWVPVSALKEGARGTWTLLAVDDTDTARVLSVQLVRVTADQAFVRGAMPDGTRLILEGPHRVVPGQLVAVN